MKMPISDPLKPVNELHAALIDFRNVFGPFDLKVTLPNVTLATPGYPINTEYQERSSQPWDSTAKHPLNDKIMAWRAKK